MNLQLLQEFLDKSNIPVYKKPPKTFLEIARQPHYENVISNIYAFYFNVNEEHGLGGLFIRSLIECIQQSYIGKQKSFESYSDFTIDTEYSTDKNGRIDLLLTGNDGAIIIENKIYHQLNNNLNDYWASIIKEDCKEGNSIGIILSLQEITAIKHVQFINITHIQLLDTVMNNIGKYMLSANDKYLTFLRDFYQNIKNLSRKNMNEKDVQFYYNNQDKINQLIEFKSNLIAHIRSEIIKVAGMLDYVTYRRPNKKSKNFQRLRYLDSSRNKNIMFTIIYNKLLDETKAIDIILEVQGASLKQLKETHSVIKFDDKESEIFKPTFKDSKCSWAHFAYKNYHVDIEDIADLSRFIHSKLVNDGFLSLFEKVHNELLESKVQE